MDHRLFNDGWAREEHDYWNRIRQEAKQFSVYVHVLVLLVILVECVDTCSVDTCLGLISTIAMYWGLNVSLWNQYSN